jgi:hypothetical protein
VAGRAAPGREVHGELGRAAEHRQALARPRAGDRELHQQVTADVEPEVAEPDRRRHGGA